MTKSLNKMTAKEIETQPMVATAARLFRNATAIARDNRDKDLEPIYSNLIVTANSIITSIGQALAQGRGYTLNTLLSARGQAAQFMLSSTLLANETGRQGAQILIAEIDTFLDSL